MDKIITRRQILVFEVYKRPSWHKYSRRAKQSSLGLAGLPMAGILDIQMSISQPFEELQDLDLEYIS